MSAADGPALGLIELCSIARGMRVCDAMVKRSPVKLLKARTTHPGKYLIIVRGGVDEVKESVGAGMAVCGDALVDHLILPFPHSELEAVLVSPQSPTLNSLGVIETFSVASTIRAADVALKRAAVSAVRLGLADDLGGKGYFVFTGALHDVEEAMEAGCEAVGQGLLAGRETIANPHPDLSEGLD